MLMVRGHYPRPYDGPIRYTVSNVDRSGRHDPGRADLIVNTRILRELERKDVFVIAHRDDGLEDENTRASDNRISGAIVGVFPEDTVIDLVAADRIG
jgi:hypothetical protein